MNAGDEGVGRAIAPSPSQSSGLDLTIRSFGKVINAHIVTSALTIFVGKNNTGKSYISTLFWALGDLARFTVGVGSREKRPEWFNHLFKRLEQEPDVELEIVINKQKAAQLIAHLNDVLRSHGHEIFRELFSFDGFASASVLVNAPKWSSDITMRIQREATRPGSKRERLNYIFSSPGKEEIGSSVPFSPSSFDAAGFVLARLLSRLLYGEAVFYSASYVPAARTGLMLSYRTIVSQLFESAKIEGQGASRLQLPQNVTSFLQEMTYDWEIENSPTRRIADWIEERLFNGTLVVSDERVPNVTFKPKDADFEIPLHAASSMITELAPMLVMLRRAVEPDLIVIEEPEAHLHLSAQRVMAQAIARLVNAGVKVIVTTHSDTLIQQINNLIKIGRIRRPMNNYYSLEDRLDPTCVSGYEFIGTDEGTRVLRLEMLPEGLVVPSLNDTLLNMAHETIELNNAIEDGSDV